MHWRDQRNSAADPVQQNKPTKHQTYSTASLLTPRSPPNAVVRSALISRRVRSLHNACCVTPARIQPEWKYWSLLCGLTAAMQGGLRRLFKVHSTTQRGLTSCLLTELPAHHRSGRLKPQRVLHPSMSQRFGWSSSEPPAPPSPRAEWFGRGEENIFIIIRLKGAFSEKDTQDY